MDLHKRLKWVRKICGLSQDEFATRLGVNVGIVKKIEAGSQRSMTSALSYPISQNFYFKMEWLEEGKGEIGGGSKANEARSRLLYHMIDRDISIDKIAADTGTDSEYLRLILNENFDDIKEAEAIKDRVDLIYGLLGSDDSPLGVCKLSSLTPEMLENTACIPRYSPTASAGHLNEVYFENIIDYLCLSKIFINTVLLVAPNNLIALNAEGDSMAPTIHNNDVLVVDKSQITPKEGKIYVIRVGNSLLVKRLQVLGPNQLKLISDNKVYDPVVIDLEKESNLSIIGRVVLYLKVG